MADITEDQLIAIWLDGFATGTASAALRLDANTEQADTFAQQMVQQAINDPAVIETIRDQIHQRLTGITDTGPTLLTACIIHPRKEQP